MDESQSPAQVGAPERIAGRTKHMELAARDW